MPDLTPTQARQWVNQELAKHQTPDSIAKRIKSEKQMLAIIKGAASPICRTANGRMKNCCAN
jgi:hypothetical protein